MSRGSLRRPGEARGSGWSDDAREGGDEAMRAGICWRRWMHTTAAASVNVLMEIEKLWMDNL